MIICSIFIGVIFAIQWWIGLIALFLAFFIFRPLVNRIPSSLKLLIDPEEQAVEIDSRTKTFRFDQIQGIYIHSKFVDEYSSAFKSTSEEHQITIGLKLDNQQLVPLFKLISDHAKHSKEMNEVHDFLETRIRKQALVDHLA